MRGCIKLARSRALLLSLSQRSRTKPAHRGGRNVLAMASPSSSPGNHLEAELAARCATSTETGQLLDLLARSDRHAGILRVAVVGDVHGAWSEADAVAVGALGADVLAFVGDFGNEAVPVVERISKVGKLIEKRRGAGSSHGGGKGGAPGVAVVCGNHDAWNSMTARGRERARERALAAAAAAGAAEEGDDADAGAAEERNNSGDPLVPAAASPGVAKQLRLLGSLHVGFSWRAFGDDDDDDDEKVEREGPGGAAAFAAVVGGRPFSQGGPDFRRVEQFYREMYGVEGFEDSTGRIVRSLREAAAHLSERGRRRRRRRDEKTGGGGGNDGDGGDGDDDDDKGTALLLIAHNGPSGLGAAKHAICGADFLEDGGDWGDPDLEEALRQVRRGSESEQQEAATAATTATAAAAATTSTSSPPSSASATPCLVAFGHMHRSLRHASSSYKERNAVEICAETGTVFLNAAAWPRARELLSSAVLQRRVVPDDGGETEVERGIGGGGGIVNGGGSRQGEPPSPSSSVHHAVVVEVDRGVVTAAHDAWVTVSAKASSSGGGEDGGGGEEGSKKKKKWGLEATQLELRELLRTERARGVDEKSGREVFFRSVWRGWTREFELVASRVPRSAPEGWEHWRFRE